MESLFNFLRKKLIWVPLAALASICTLIQVFKSCDNDRKEKVINTNLSIISSSFKALKSIDIEDSVLLTDPLIYESKKVQEEILIFRDFVSLLNLSINENLPDSILYDAYFYKSINLYTCTEKIIKVGDDYKRVLEMAIADSIKCADDSYNQLKIIFITDNIEELRKNDSITVMFMCNSSKPKQDKVNYMKVNNKDNQYIPLYSHVYDWSERAFVQLNKIIEEKLLIINK